jgi:hypothetical protein
VGKIWGIVSSITSLSVQFEELALDGETSDAFQTAKPGGDPQVTPGAVHAAVTESMDNVLDDDVLDSVVIEELGLEIVDVDEAGTLVSQQMITVVLLELDPTIAAATPMSTTTATMIATRPISQFFILNSSW